MTTRQNDDVAKLRLLALSYAYPPLAQPRSIQISRLLGAAQIPTCLVCCDDPGANKDATIWPDDTPSFLKTRPVPFQRSKAIEVMRKICIHSGFRLPLKLPDYQIFWQKAAFRALDSIMEAEQFNPTIFISFGMPMSDHLTGLRFKKKYGLPWLAHFSDPWADNPFHGYGKLARKINERLEKRVIEQADRLIFTCKESLNLVMSKYPEKIHQKAKVLHHAFAPERYREPPTDDGGITIRHIGSFYGPRSPLPLFKGLAKILQSSPTVLDGVQFELVGNNALELAAKAALESLPHGLVSLIPPVTYQESLDLMASADGLAVIDAPGESSPFFPSKLADYIGSKRPLLGLTPPGPSRRIIHDLGGFTADPRNESHLATAIAAFIRHIKSSSIQNTSFDSHDQFSTSTIADSFTEILNEIL